jgi:hypothetical protein
MRVVGVAVAVFIALGLPQGAVAEPPAAGQHGGNAPVVRASQRSSDSRPVVTTDAAGATGATTASIEGNADPEGQITKLRAGYALANERWCTTHGMRGTPVKTASRSLGSGRAMLSEVVVKLEGLTPGREYCAELLATNRSGASYGGQRRFATPYQDAAQVPSHTTTPAQSSARGRASKAAPSAPGSGGWPTATVVIASVLGVIVLGGALSVARPKLRRRRSAKRHAVG